MPNDVFTPVWSGQGRVATTLELSLRDAGGATPAKERRSRLSLGVRAGARPHGGCPQLGAVHDRVAGQGPRVEPRGRVHPLQPRRGPAHQSDRRPAELGRVVLSAVERLFLVLAPT